MLKRNKILKVTMKRSWKVMVIRKSKICFKKSLSSGKTTLKELTLDKKHHHIDQNSLRVATCAKKFWLFPNNFGFHQSN